MNDWAPYHVVRTDLPCAECQGQYYDLRIALSMLRTESRHNKDKSYAIVWDGGILDEAAAEDLLNKRATEKMNQHLKLLRKAA